MKFFSQVTLVAVITICLAACNSPTERAIGGGAIGGLGGAGIGALASGGSTTGTLGGAAIGAASGAALGALTAPSPPAPARY
jgi:hypothetical protein